MNDQEFLDNYNKATGITTDIIPQTQTLQAPQTSVDLSITAEDKQFLSDYDQAIAGTGIETPAPIPESKLTPETVLNKEMSRYTDPMNAGIEAATHLGVGVLAYFPSLAAGAGQFIHDKSINVMTSMSEAFQIDKKQALQKKLSKAKSLPEYQDIYNADRYEKAKRELTLEQMKKTPEQIRANIDDAMSLISEMTVGQLEEPKYKSTKDALKLADLALSEVLLYYPAKADKWLTEKGFPNAGWMFKSAGELTMFKMMHSSGKEVKTTVNNYMKFLEDIRPELYKPDISIEKIESRTNEYFDSIDKPEGKALKRPTISQMKKAHQYARDLKMSEEVRRNLAEEITGVRTMKKMNRDTAKQFLDRLREMKKDGKKPVETTKLKSRSELPEGEESDLDIPYRDQPGGRVQPMESIPPADVPKTIRMMGLDKEGIGLDYIRDLSKETQAIALNKAPVKKGMVTVYRAGQSEIRQGDFVTFSKESAKKYLEGAGKEAKLYTKEIPTNELYSPNPNEALWLPREIEKSTKPVPAELKTDVASESVGTEAKGKGEPDRSAEVKRWVAEQAEKEPTHEVEARSLFVARVKQLADLTSEQVQDLFLRDEFTETIMSRIDEAFRRGAGNKEITAEARRVADEVIKRLGKEKPVKLAKSVEIKEVEPVEPTKPQPSKPIISESIQQVISDDIIIAEDMGIYANVKDIITGKKRIGVDKILTELKKSPDYVQDMKDFGYSDPDIRSAIRAIKAEGGNKTALKHIENELKAETEAVERIKTEKKAKVAEPVKPAPESLPQPKRVDPETGRKPGVKEDLTRKPTEPDEVVEAYLASRKPITKDGKVVKTKAIAKQQVAEMGMQGELVKNTDGEGWVVEKAKTKKTKAQLKKERELEQKQWEEILKDEELGDLEDQFGERVDVDVDKVGGDRSFPFNEKGYIELDTKLIKDIKDRIKKGFFSRNRAIKELRVRGATDKDILKVFSDASVRILNEGKESKWLKKGQDPLALLKRRKLPGKEKGKAPAVTRGEAHMIATINDMPVRLTSEHLSWENAIRTFEKLPPAVKETFYRTVKEGESLAFDHLREILKRSKKIRNSVPYISHKRIGIHAIAKQPDGLEVLAQQGITKIPKLRPKEIKAYESLRAIYDELFPLINKAREAAGEKPFPKMENYFTWVQDLMQIEEVKDGSLFSDTRTIESKMAEHKRVPSFRFAKFRAGPEKARRLSLNPFSVMDGYAKSATHYIEMGPRLAKLNELMTEKFGMAKNAPNAYNFMRHWLDYQAGKIPAWDIANPKTRRAMQVLNGNVVYSLLAYNVRSALIQPAALASSYTVLGEYYMAKGIAQIIRPAKWKMAGKLSNVLNTRSPEVALYEAMHMGKKLPGQVKQKIAQVGTAPLAVLDSIAARITWLGAFEKATKSMKLGKREAINYADDIVTRTQASAAKSDVAPIQRTQIGKTITSLQTFVINHWGFLTKDVMGIKNADIKNPTRVKNVIRFVLATTAVNAFYEDVLKMNSPNPTPIRAYQEKFEETEDSAKAFAASLKEIAEYVPIFGGRLRYGSEIGGPVMTEALKLIGKGDMQAAIKLLGVSGSNQFFKMLRAKERGGSGADIALGRYVEPPKKKSTSLTSGFGGSGGLSGKIKDD